MRCKIHKKKLIKSRAGNMICYDCYEEGLGERLKYWAELREKQRKTRMEIEKQKY